MPDSLEIQPLIFTTLPIPLSDLCSSLFPDSGTTVVILALTDLAYQTKDTLAQWLHQEELMKRATLNYEKRNREYSGGRLCAKQGLRVYLRQKKSKFIPAHNLCHVAAEESGRPYFMEFPGIHFSFPELSISHSKDYATALVSSEYCGIDIQYPAANLNKVKERFAVASEERLLQEHMPMLSSLEQLCLLWAGKEAVKKMLSPNGIPGFHQLTLTTVIPESGHFAQFIYTGSDQYAGTFPTAAGILDRGYGLALCCQAGQSQHGESHA